MTVWFFTYDPGDSVLCDQQYGPFSTKEKAIQAAVAHQKEGHGGEFTLLETRSLRMTSPDSFAIYWITEATIQ